MKAVRSFPLNLAQPAQRALANAGITTLQQCAKLGENELAKLHGMGPDALGKIKEAMKAKGISFSKA